jgi:hypothetical protein
MVPSITDRLASLTGLSDPAAYPAFDIYPGLLDSSIAPSPVEDDILSPPQSSVSAHPAFDICK